MQPTARADGSDRHRGPPPGGTRPPGRVLDLTDRRAADPGVAGAKAANLARAASAGLPVLPGVVLPTGRTPDLADLREAWERLSQGGQRPLVVRSSSTVEDAGESSMAGQFRSVLGVRHWNGFQRAVDDVLRSSARRASPGSPPAPMAVLVQPELTAVCAGVLFGIDPVSGDRRRLLVEAVPGNPHVLVDGSVTAARELLTRHGHAVERSEPPLLDGRRRRALARLARAAERVFGRPQDVEWAFDGAGRLWLLQSRPVTATGHAGLVRGPVLGPGPVGETFPFPLRPLESDLWLPPLRQGIAEALRVTGAASPRRRGASPVVTTVGGWVAVDLDLLGTGPVAHPVARALDPRRGARHLLAAWRVGHLRAALPGLAAATVRRVDRDLAAVPALAALADVALADLLRQAPEELAALHAAEVLAGMLLPAEPAEATAASAALAALAGGRAAGWSDAETVARRPVVLALTAPAVGGLHPLPATPADGGARPPAAGAVAALGAREALRLRARWVQEASAQAAAELGGRLAAAGRLASAGDVALLTLDELVAVTGGAAPPPSDELSSRAASLARPPLPAAFRLTPAGEVMAVRAGRPAAGGRAAGGGRGVGPVRHDPAEGTGGVLVVDVLSPELAGALPGLAGLVSETGSTLSHLAILARELGVPTVVGLAGARRRYPPGTTVVVDGGTGEVSVVAGPEESAS